MTPEQFTYWLQGYVEVNGTPPSEGQWQVIKDHLQAVFHKVTPTYVHPLDIPNGSGTWPNPNKPFEFIC